MEDVNILDILAMNSLRDFVTTWGSVFVGVIGMIFTYKTSKKLGDESAVNLVSEFYFIEDMTSNWDSISSELKRDALYKIGKIVSKGKFISIDDEKIIKYLFERHGKDIELLRMYFRTDKLIFKEGIGLVYKNQDKRQDKFKERFYTALYFIFAGIALFPIFSPGLGALIGFEKVEKLVLDNSSYIWFTISWGLLFLILALMALVQFSKFYWANKLLNEIYPEKIKKKND